MITIPFDHRVRTDREHAARPSWGVVIFNGKAWPYFMCACGARGAISDHEIDERGVVSPSVLHTCGFHAFIQLDSWPGWEYLDLNLKQPVLN